jgi:hypothetical protein
MTACLAQAHDHTATATPATLLAGLGTYHHAIVTKSPEAQRFFDQGLTLLYGFNHARAIRQFERAAELDPSAPMPIWGIALAYGPNINDFEMDRDRAKTADEYAKKALASPANAKERAHRASEVRVFERSGGRPEGAAGELQGRDTALAKAYPAISTRRSSTPRA